MTQQIKMLNCRLADALGRLGAEGRFQWVWAPDLYYYHRNHPAESWVRHSWGDRIGKRWVLAQLRPPVGLMGDQVVPITEEQWWASFHGEFPFPGKRTPHPFPETALLPGLVPDDADTAFYIRSLGAQMDKTMAELKSELDAELEKDRLANKQQFFEMADDWFPFGWSSKTGAHAPGTRGGGVSFGGLA